MKNVRTDRTSSQRSDRSSSARSGVDTTARKATVARPRTYSAADIRALRRDLGVSQPVFAGMLNVSGSTVRAWEQGQRQPDGPTLRLLEVAERHPDALLSQMQLAKTPSEETVDDR